MQVKHKLRNQFQILNYIVSTNKFRTLFLISLILCIYGTIGLTSLDETYIDTVLTSFQFYIFNLFLFLILFLNTLSTCTIFNKEFSNYIIRLKSKKRYIIEMIKTALLLNIFLFVLIFIIYFIFLNMLKLNNIKIVPFIHYKINNLTYLLFYLFRYFIYSLLIMVITTIIYINFKEKITLGISSLFLFGFLNDKFNAKLVDTLILKPWPYFSTVWYKSFKAEIKLSVIYFLILLIITIILYFITLKNKRWEIT